MAGGQQGPAVSLVWVGFLPGELGESHKEQERLGGREIERPMPLGSFLPLPTPNLEASSGLGLLLDRGRGGGVGILPFLAPSPYLTCWEGQPSAGGLSESEGAEAILLQMKPQEDGGWKSGKTLPELHLQTLSPMPPPAP